MTGWYKSSLTGNGVTSDGATGIEPKYDYIFPFKGSFAGIKKNDKYGFVNLDGEEIIKPCFDEIGIISPDGSVNVRNGDRWESITLTD